MYHFATVLKLYIIRYFTIPYWIMQHALVIHCQYV